MSLPRGTGLRARLDAACTSLGLQPRIAFEASDPTMLALLAARGLGVAIVPESLSRSRPDDLHPITITDPELRSRVELAWRSAGPTSPAARALIDHARRTMATPERDD